MERKFYVKLKSNFKELCEGVYIDASCTVVCENPLAHINDSERDDGVCVVVRLSDYETRIYNVNRAYEALFGAEVPGTKAEENPENTEEAEPKLTLGQKSDMWVKDPHARYNYRALKDAYVWFRSGGRTMKEAAREAGVTPTTLSNMARKQIHVKFTDALDEEYGFGLYSARKKKHRKSKISDEDIRNVYISIEVLGMSKESVSAKYKLSVSSVMRILKRELRPEVIDELISSGKNRPAEKRI